MTTVSQGSTAIFIPCIDSIVASLEQGCRKVVAWLVQGCDKVVTTLLEGCPDPGIVNPASQFLVVTRWSQGCK